MRKKHQNKNMIMISPQVEKNLNDYNALNLCYKYSNTFCQSKKFL